MHTYKNIFWLFGLVWVSILFITSLASYKSLPSKSNLQLSSVLKKEVIMNNISLVVSASPTPILSLDTIFDDVLLETDEKPWKLVVGGDYNPGRHVNMLATNQDNFSLLDNLKLVFGEADIAMVNLEGALVHDCPLISDGMKFCGNLRHAEALHNAGIDIVSLANNHSLNFGFDGLEETKAVLKQHSVQYAGFDEITYIKLSDLGEVAIIGIDATLKERNPQEIVTLVALAHKRSPVVIPYFHWGSEYTEDPNQRQQDLAHAAIEAGATLVLGSHPHWVQAVEIYNQKLIVYSHGNLVFDQFWSEKTRQGIVGEYYFLQDRLVDARFQPIYIGYGYKPYVLEGEAAIAVTNPILQASERYIKYE